METYCVKEKKKPNALNQVEQKRQKMEDPWHGVPVHLVELKNFDL